MSSRLIVEDPAGASIQDLVVRADPDGPYQEILYFPGTNILRHMRFERDGATGPVPSQSGRDGVHHLFHSTPIEVEVDAENHRAVMIALQGGTERVRLREALEVELRLIGTEELPPNVRARITLRRHVGRGRSSTFGYSGTTFKLRSPGTWDGTVELQFFRRDYSDQQEGQEIRVQVRDVPGIQRFDIHLDAVTFESARELARRNSDR